MFQSPGWKGSFYGSEDGNGQGAPAAKQPRPNPQTGDTNPLFQGPRLCIMDLDELRSYLLGRCKSEAEVELLISAVNEDLRARAMMEVATSMRNELRFSGRPGKNK